MSPVDIVILLIVAAIVGFIIFRSIRRKKAGKTGCCDCSSTTCPGAGANHIENK